MTFNHRFPGQYRDSETGLYQNWYRDYDPKLGRYITSDPVGLQAGPNTFHYVGGIPTMKADPSGLLPLDDSTYFQCLANCIGDTKEWAYLSAANLVNTAANAITPPTGQGFGSPSHPTSWQHRVGRAIGKACESPVTGRIGKFLGRLMVAATLAEGAVDWAIIGTCAVSCFGE
jgi:RHS repeat-associated protein